MASTSAHGAALAAEPKIQNPKSVKNIGPHFSIAKRSRASALRSCKKELQRNTQLPLHSPLDTG
jgi:hypothetical protein